MSLAGGRIADSKGVCFSLSWNDSVDLDLCCKMPNNAVCSFRITTQGNCTLDVDRRASGSDLKVENISLTVAGCPDGEYKYFVRYFASNDNKAGDLAVDFTVVLNQFGKKIEEGTAKAEIVKADVPCLTLTMKDGKVVNTKFHIKTKEILDTANEAAITPTLYKYIFIIVIINVYFYMCIHLMILQLYVAICIYLIFLTPPCSPIP